MDAGLLGLLHHFLHHAHGGGEQGGAADDLAALVDCGLHIGLGRHVGAQVDDFQALALHHHLHQVLADVVQIALHGADAHLAHGLHACLGHQRLEQRGAHVHGAGGHQHFRHEHFVVLELLADHAHAGQKALVQDLLHGNALVDGLLHQLFDDLGFALLKIFGNVGQNAHGCSPPLFVLGRRSAVSF